MKGSILATSKCEKWARAGSTIERSINSDYLAVGLLEGDVLRDTPYTSQRRCWLGTSGVDKVHEFCPRNIVHYRLLIQGISIDLEDFTINYSDLGIAPFTPPPLANAYHNPATTPL